MLALRYDDSTINIIFFIIIIIKFCSMIDNIRQWLCFVNGMKFALYSYLAVVVVDSGWVQHRPCWGDHHGGAQSADTGPQKQTQATNCRTNSHWWRPQSECYWPGRRLRTTDRRRRSSRNEFHASELLADDDRDSTLRPVRQRDWRRQWRQFVSVYRQVSHWDANHLTCWHAS